jgi:hypothetical protein
LEVTGKRVVVPAQLADTVRHLAAKISLAISVLVINLQLFRDRDHLPDSGTLEDLECKTDKLVVAAVFPFPMLKLRYDLPIQIVQAFPELIIDPATYTAGHPVHKDNTATTDRATDSRVQRVLVKRFLNTFDLIVRESFVLDAFVPQCFTCQGNGIVPSEEQFPRFLGVDIGQQAINLACFRATLKAPRLHGPRERAAELF